MGQIGCHFVGEAIREVPFSGSVLRFVNGRTAIDVVRATACSGEPLTGVDGLVRR